MLGPASIDLASRVGVASVALEVAQFVPDHYEPNYAYPLVVALHGRGGDERRGTELVSALSRRNYVGLSLRGPEPVTKAGRPVGHGWGPAFRESPRVGDEEREAPVSFERAWRDPLNDLEEAVFDAVRRARRLLHVHSERVYLVGTGEGGAAALRLGLACPDRFAGAAAIGGWFPHESRPLARVKDLRGFRLFLAEPEWGPKDRLRKTTRVARGLHAAGVDVRLQTYPVLRPLPRVVRDDLDAWLLGPLTGPHAFASR